MQLFSMVVLIVLTVHIIQYLLQYRRERNTVENWNHRYMLGTAQAGFQNEAAPQKQPPSMWRTFVNKLYKNLKSPQHIDISQFERDIEHLKSMGGNSYRFSIEWARVQMSRNSWDTTYYHQICEILEKHNIRPVITLFHFVVPPWAERTWEIGSPDFRHFACTVVKEFSRYMPFFITLNEPYLYVLHGYFIGARPPFQKSAWTCLTVLCNMLKDHIHIYRYCKMRYVACQVSIAKNLMPIHAGNTLNPIDQALRIHFHNWFNDSYFFFARTGIIRLFFMGAYKYCDLGYGPTLDFFGVNHYTEISFSAQCSTSQPIDVQLRPPDLLYGTVLSKAGWIVSPLSWHRTLQMIMENVDLPIIVTECGVSNIDKSDSLIGRREAIANILSTLQMCPRVKGVLVWTLVANIEWESGDTVDFGIFRHNRTKSEIYEPIKAFFDAMAS